MRKITSITLHCSDSSNYRHDNVKTIRRWHVKDNGWDDIGYHFIITKDGKSHEGRKVSVMGAHVKGFNKESIGICLTGKKEFSYFQKESLFQLVDVLQDVYKVKDSEIYCHYQLDKNKTCPNFTIETFNSGYLKWKKQRSQCEL